MTQHASATFDLERLDLFRLEVRRVAEKRDLGTATEYGAILNRLVSALDRMGSSLSDEQRRLLALSHAHMRSMMNCPRRMRLDNTWPDDFVREAVAAVDALILLAKS